MFERLIWFPFLAAGFGFLLLIGLIILAFWVWMIIDCAKRRFNNDVEKIVWLVIIVLGQWIGALVYLLAIKLTNERGLISR